MKKFLIALLLLLPVTAFAQFTTFQGGTGTTSPSGVLLGDQTLHLKTLKIGSGLLLSGGTLSSTAGGGTVTNIATTWPIIGGPITTTGTLSLDLSTSTLTATTPLTGSFTQVGSGGTLGIQASSPIQNGYLSLGDYQLLHTASTTFTSPLVYTLSTNAVTCPTCSTFAYPFSVFSTFSTTTAATTTSISTQGVFFSSSTAQSSQFPYASTTMLTASGSIFAGASSTIGGGTNAAGLSIAGNSTTTFSGNAGTPATSAIMNTGGQAGQESILFLGGFSNLYKNALVSKLNSGGATSDLIFRYGNGATIEGTRLSGTTGNFGIGATTTPGALLSIHANAGTNRRNLFVVASSTATATTTLFTINNSGDVVTSGPTPIVGACGTAAISATSTDMRGTISVTAGNPTSCNVVFSSIKSDTPTCIADGPSSALGSVGITAASTTGVQLNLPAVFAGNIYYICLQ